MYTSAHWVTDRKFLPKCKINEYVRAKKKKLQEIRSWLRSRRENPILANRLRTLSLFIYFFFFGTKQSSA